MIRLFAILFLPVYLGVALKWQVDIHYCGGHVKRVSFFGVHNKSCCGEIEKMPSGCCHDDSFTMDSDNHDFHEDIIRFDIDQDEFHLPPLSPFVFVPIKETCLKVCPVFISEDPPPRCKVPIYIQHCTYLI